jgi:hypothetical protein
VNTVMNLQLPYHVRKFISSWATRGISSTWLHGVSNACLS